MYTPLSVEFDDGDLPDLDQKGGEQDQTGNNPSNDNTEAVDTNSWGKLPTPWFIQYSSV